MAKVELQDGSSGSGFLVDGDLLLTNNHVLPDVQSARSALVHFNYQLNSAGQRAAVDSRQLQPDEFFRTDVNDDWTAVRVEGNPTKSWGLLALTPATISVGHRVNIIQHPGGGYKKLAYLSNVVVFSDQDRLQYLTDTEPGSSGSPVFDRHWNVVGIHHSGGSLPEPGSPDPTREYLRNEGILIDVLIAGLGR